MAFAECKPAIWQPSVNREHLTPPDGRGEMHPEEADERGGFVAAPSADPDDRPGGGGIVRTGVLFTP